MNTPHHHAPGDLGDWRNCLWCGKPESDPIHFCLDLKPELSSSTPASSAPRPATRAPRKKSEFFPLSALERSLIEKLSLCRFPPATAAKRFVRDLSAGAIAQMSNRGRGFLAFVAFRYRRQWADSITRDERAWVCFWLGFRDGAGRGPSKSFYRWVGETEGMEVFQDGAKQQSQLSER